jgi:PadR family transcriptional regulator PadR
VEQNKFSAESSQWVEKEKDQLLSSVNKISLLSIIENYHDRGGIHGYAIGQALYEYSSGGLSGTNATYYAILRRLEKDGLLYSRIEDSSTGPPRKHYYLTAQGKSAINTLWKNWKYYYYLLDEMITKQI